MYLWKTKEKEMANGKALQAIFRMFFSGIHVLFICLNAPSPAPTINISLAVLSSSL